jgi:hypothetical protein
VEEETKDTRDTQKKVGVARGEVAFITKKKGGIRETRKKNPERHD